jgi:hypothetical protein
MEEINKEIGLDALLRRAGSENGLPPGQLTPEEKEEKVEVNSTEEHVE